MVRLKAFLACGEDRVDTGFNSTMVRLKVVKLLKDGGVAVAFQFHNGSIKSLRYLCLWSMLSSVSIPQWFD